MTEQTSASDRYEAARKALARFWNPDDLAEMEIQGELVHALEALVTPPGVGESEAQIVERWAGRLRRRGAIEVLGEEAVFNATDHHGQSIESFRQGVRAGIQSAHESWEPEVAQRPTQEQMLRWLGIEYDETDGEIFIPDQFIKREED